MGTPAVPFKAGISGDISGRAAPQPKVGVVSSPPGFGAAGTTTMSAPEDPRATGPALFWTHEVHLESTSPEWVKGTGFSIPVRTIADRPADVPTFLLLARFENTGNPALYAPGGMRDKSFRPRTAKFTDEDFLHLLETIPPCVFGTFLPQGPGDERAIATLSVMPAREVLHALLTCPHYNSHSERWRFAIPQAPAYSMLQDKMLIALDYHGVLDLGSSFFWARDRRNREVRMPSPGRDAVALVRALRQMGFIVWMCSFIQSSEKYRDQCAAFRERLAEQAGYTIREPPPCAMP